VRVAKGRAKAVAVATVTAVTPAAPLWRARWLAALLQAVDRARASEMPLAADSAGGVRDIRRAMKEIEALLRLAPRSEREAATKARLAARAVRQSLGEARDAKVAVYTLRNLPTLPGGAVARRVLVRRLAQSADAAEAKGVDEAERMRLRANFAALSKMLAAMPSPGGDDFLVRGLARSYHRARSLAAQALASGETAALHEFRKRVVILRYQVGFAEPLWPRPMVALARELQRLRDRLGRVNDLAVLAALVEAEAGQVSALGRRAIEAGMAASRADALEKAGRLSAQVLAERPAAFRRRLTAYFEAEAAPPASAR
jgi:CHAD domain-containing protein